jgi:hypothetical protein
VMVATDEPPTVPLAFDNKQFCPIGDDGLVKIVTEYVVPLATAVGNVKVPFADRVRLSPKLFCSVTVSPGVSPRSSPPIGCVSPPRSTDDEHPATKATMSTTELTSGNGRSTLLTANDVLEPPCVGTVGMRGHIAVDECLRSGAISVLQQRLCAQHGCFRRQRATGKLDAIAVEKIKR